MAVAEASSLLPALRAAASSDPAKTRDLITRLKILITEFPSQSSAASASSASVAEAESAIIMEVLEHAVLAAIAAGDVKAFERNMAQLKPHYQAMAASHGASSGSEDRETSRRHVIGLYLMHLLTCNNLSAMHAEVEALLTHPGDRDHPFIAFPLAMERRLAEGAYNKVLSAQGSMPSPQFAPFMGRLVATARDDIADCAEASYGSLTVAAAKRLMMLDSEAQVAAYVAESRPSWRISGSTITFDGASAAAGGGKAATAGAAGGVDALTLMGTALGYASELEKIV